MKGNIDKCLLHFEFNKFTSIQDENLQIENKI